MDLDIRQTRRLYLAGAVPFPVRYPTVGAISIEQGKLHGHVEKTLFVVVREETERDQATTRVILAEYVAAIFYYKGKGRRVDNFEDGEWVWGPINAEKSPDKKIVAARRQKTELRRSPRLSLRAGEWRRNAARANRRVRQGKQGAGY